MLAARWVLVLLEDEPLAEGPVMAQFANEPVRLEASMSVNDQYENIVETELITYSLLHIIGVCCWYTRTRRP